VLSNYSYNSVAPSQRLVVVKSFRLRSSVDNCGGLCDDLSEETLSRSPKAMKAANRSQSGAVRLEFTWCRWRCRCTWEHTFDWRIQNTVDQQHKRIGDERRCRWWGRTKYLTSTSKAQ